MDHYKNVELKIEENSKKIAKATKYGFFAWAAYVIGSMLLTIAIVGIVIHFVIKAW